jgi:hypothetical protein
MIQPLLLIVFNGHLHLGREAEKKKTGNEPDRGKDQVKESQKSASDA